MEEESQEGGEVAQYVVERIGERRPTIADLPPSAVRLTVGGVFATPRGSYVYFLFSGSECVYIGQTVSLRQRMAAHATVKGFDEAFYINTPIESRSLVERHWIRLLRPQINRVLYAQHARAVRKRGPRSAGKNVSMPPDWWEAFARAAEKSGQSLSEWMGDNLRECLPASEQRKLSERTGRGRPPVEK